MLAFFQIKSPHYNGGRGWIQLVANALIKTKRNAKKNKSIWKHSIVVLNPNVFEKIPLLLFPWQYDQQKDFCLK